MSDNEIMAAIGAAAITLWLALGLIGWVLPLRDGATRFTFRYFAWGALFVYWLAKAVEQDVWWKAIFPFALMFWTVDRIGHWWRKSEAARQP